MGRQALKWAIDLLLSRNTRMSFELSHGEVSALSGTPPKVIPEEKDWSCLRPLILTRQTRASPCCAGPVPKGTSPYKGPLKVEKYWVAIHSISVMDSTGVCVT